MHYISLFILQLDQFPNMVHWMDTEILLLARAQGYSVVRNKQLGARGIFCDRSAP